MYRMTWALGSLHDSLHISSRLTVDVPYIRKTAVFCFCYCFVFWFVCYCCCCCCYTLLVLLLCFSFSSLSHRSFVTVPHSNRIAENIGPTVFLFLLQCFFFVWFLELPLVFVCGNQRNWTKTNTDQLFCCGACGTYDIQHTTQMEMHTQTCTIT